LLTEYPGDDKLLDYITIGTRDAGIDLGQELPRCGVHWIRSRGATGLLTHNSVAGSAVNPAHSVRADRGARA